MKARVLLRASLLIPLLVVVAAGCRRDASAPPAVATPAASDRPAPREPAVSREDQPTRDLSMDESKGGHTLARHVGKTDAELRERLRREPQISSASTYTDRTRAEQSVGAALATSGRTLEAWENRTGRRPNLVLHYRNPKRQPVGRSLSRSQQASMPSSRVLVVLRWDERGRTFYVLTSYPEAER